MAGYDRRKAGAHPRRRATDRRNLAAFRRRAAVLDPPCPDCRRPAMECPCIDGPGGERRCTECGDSYNLDEQDHPTLCLSCETAAELDPTGDCCVGCWYIGDDAVATCPGPDHEGV